VNILRLWRARATREFDFRLFDEGDYVRAVEQKILSENITKVLYPNDSTRKGRQLRLQQQYFFVACSLKDILRRFLLLNEDWSDLPEKIAMQLNDTHPVVAIPELMRLLMDEYGLGWERSWDLARRCFAYTCHTLLPEALERWPVDLFGELLPRHLEIVTEINHRFLAAVHSKFPDDDSRVQRMSIIDDASRQIRMANLATVGSRVPSTALPSSNRSFCEKGHCVISRNFGQKNFRTRPMALRLADSCDWPTRGCQS
jgi:starch phosphorylase